MRAYFSVTLLAYPARIVNHLVGKSLAISMNSNVILEVFMFVLECLSRLRVIGKGKKQSVLGWKLLVNLVMVVLMPRL